MKNKNTQPLISVIMPVYNAAPYLKLAINSILNQTYSNFEFIIINDFSTDNSFKILKSFKDKRLKIFSNSKNLGVAGSLNKALKIAKGKFIARMDADDISHPTRLAKQLDFLQKNKKIIACGLQVEIIDNNNQLISFRNFPINPKTCHDFLMLTSPLLHPTLMAKASIYKKIGYTAKYKTAEDWDLYFKIIKYGQISNLNETLYSYRQLFGSNGFKNIKKAFVLITKIRFEAIKNGYQPAVLMLISNLIQAIIVFLLPEKLVFRLFSFWRTNKNTTNKALISQPA